LGSTCQTAGSDGASLIQAKPPTTIKINAQKINFTTPYTLASTGHLPL